MSNSLIETWRKIIVGKEKSWVLFENGTVVILMQPETDLKQQAVRLLEKFGKVFAGTPAGDFSVIDLQEDDGWVVACHHPDILNYVSPGEIEEEPEDWKIGLTGRSKRNDDANELNIIHVEDKRISSNSKSEI